MIAKEEIIEALQLNKAVFELFTDAANGDIDALDLANMTNKAMELNSKVLAALVAEGLE